MGKNWIQRAVKRPGELTRKLRGKLGRIIIGATKRPIWTKSGEINTITLRKFRKTKAYEKLDTRTKRQINFAITAEGFRKDKKNKRKNKKEEKAMNILLKILAFTSALGYYPFLWAFSKITGQKIPSFKEFLEEW